MATGSRVRGGSGGRAHLAPGALWCSCGFRRGGRRLRPHSVTAAAGAAAAGCSRGQLHAVQQRGLHRRVVADGAGDLAAAVGRAVVPRRRREAPTLRGAARAGLALRNLGRGLPTVPCRRRRRPRLAPPRSPHCLFIFFRSRRGSSRRESREREREQEREPEPEPEPELEYERCGREGALVLPRHFRVFVGLLSGVLAPAVGPVRLHLCVVCCTGKGYAS